MMRPLASLFLHKQQNHSCGCVCREETSVARRPSWLDRIRRKSSSSISTQSTSDSSSTEATQYLQEKDLDYFINLYELAVDEIRYATEFQGSIYYDADLLDAKEAVVKCLYSFQCIVHVLPTQRSYEFQQKWSTLLADLRNSLEALPSD